VCSVFMDITLQGVKIIPAHLMAIGLVLQDVVSLLKDYNNIVTKNNGFYAFKEILYLWKLLPTVIDMIRCNVLRNLSNGYFLTQEIPILGSEAVLHCKQGYVVNGTGTYYCSNTGQWSGEANCSKQNL